MSLSRNWSKSEWPFKIRVINKLFYVKFKGSSLVALEVKLSINIAKFYSRHASCKLKMQPCKLSWRDKESLLNSLNLSSLGPRNSWILSRSHQTIVSTSMLNHLNNWKVIYRMGLMLLDIVNLFACFDFILLWFVWLARFMGINRCLNAQWLSILC